MAEEVVGEGCVTRSKRVNVTEDPAADFHTKVVEEEEGEDEVVAASEEAGVEVVVTEVVVETEEVVGVSAMPTKRATATEVPPADSVTTKLSSLIDYPTNSDPRTVFKSSSNDPCRLYSKVWEYLTLHVPAVCHKLFLRILCHSVLSQSLTFCIMK